MRKGWCVCIFSSQVSSGPHWYPLHQMLLLLKAEASSLDRLGESLSWMPGSNCALWASFLFKTELWKTVSRYLGVSIISEYRPSFLLMPIQRWLSTAQVSLQMHQSASKGNRELGCLDLEGEHSRQWGGQSIGFYDLTSELRCDKGKETRLRTHQIMWPDTWYFTFSLMKCRWLGPSLRTLVLGTCLTICALLDLTLNQELTLGAPKCFKSSLANKP